MPPSITRDQLVMALRAALMSVDTWMDANEIHIGSLRLQLAGLVGYRDRDGCLVLTAAPTEQAQADPQWVPMLMLNNALDAALALSQAKGESRSLHECAEEVRRAVGVLIRDNSLATPSVSH